jgi:hypothetical protein
MDQTRKFHIKTRFPNISRFEKSNLVMSKQTHQNRETHIFGAFSHEPSLTKNGRMEKMKKNSKHFEMGLKTKVMV